MALILLLLLGGIPALADRNAERALYRDALADLYAVRLASFEAKLERLENDPLFPYLHYARILRYISSTEPAAVVAFRERFADTPLADQVLLQWLDNLARRGEWATYREHYDPELASSAGLQCRYYRALLETGAREEGLAGAERLWLSGESRPKVCDPLFDVWRAAGRLDDALAWQRILLALEANRPSLAGYLLRYLDPDSRTLAEDLITLHREPLRLRRIRSLPGDDARVAEVLGHSLRRLARRDPDSAEAEFRTWTARVELPADEARRTREEILRWQIRRNRVPDAVLADWPPPELEGSDHSDLVEELIRRAITNKEWGAVLTWIERLPATAHTDSAWQYWTARASLELAATSEAPGPALWQPTGPETPAGLPLASLVSGASGGPFVALPEDSIDEHFSVRRPDHHLALAPRAATALLASVASRRNYYGFMAAEYLGQPFDLQDEALELSAKEVAAVENHPAFQRAVELKATGELRDARRELAWLRGHLDTRELLVLAELSGRHGWHDQAIHATIAAREWNRVDLRFPLAFAGPMLSNAGRQELQPSWLFAVARQESAFMTDARSHAGALGVMQVMPATARLTARRQNIPLANTWQLLDHNKNIEIGSSYLAQMYDRYNGNRMLASAAYNAGPGRVDQWLALRDPTPADIWIEAIPFRETRHYVQNVLAYAVIYGHRLQAEHPLLFDHER